LRLDGQATVPIGEVSRGGLTRGDTPACEHDWGLKEQDMPGGLVDEDPGELRIMLGRSSKPSDCIVDALAARWAALEAQEQATTERVQINMDNGPESRGIRTPFLHRMVQCADHIGTPVQRLYDPPYHSKYPPIERCWGMLELPWHGTTLIHVEPMLEWAKSLTWKGIHPVVERSRKVDQKGMSRGKRAMRAVEKRLERHPELPKWDILIRPASAS
jgi:hypothetical protein